jgi:hypothetical protein
VALCPFAKHKLIPPGSNDPRITPRVAILHVAVSIAASLFAFFRDRSGGIESHFYITLTGRIEQYRDTGWQADANYQANDFAISIETAGWGNGRWNRRPLAAIKRLLTWLHETEGIPLQRCPQWDGAGVGYHVQFGSPGPWTPVSKSCPGPNRIKQYDHDLVPWMLTEARTTTEEDDMSVMDFMRHKLNKDGLDVAEALRDAHQAAARTKRIENAVSELATALDKLAPGVAAAVHDALAEAVVDVDVTVQKGGQR